jgi:hypothetical protein
VPIPTGTPTPAPVTINVGTRFEAILTHPLVTGAAIAPATARVASDVHVGERLVIAAGTLLVGEAFAIQHNDRAQVVFSALIKAGKTVPFEGWTLQDGEMGVRGKVLREGSKAKKGTSVMLGAAASALTFGLVGARSGMEGAVLSSVRGSAAGELSSISRDLQPSDKVLRVEADVRVTVYVRRDVTLE